MQYSAHTINGHRHRTVHGVIHIVHGSVLRVADDRHNRSVRAHWTPSSAVGQTETHHHGEVIERREKNFVPRIQSQFIVESTQNAR